MSLGVRLTARYFPCLIDIETPHGGVPLIFNEDMNTHIDIFKRRIIEQMPAFKDAHIFVRERYY